MTTRMTTPFFALLAGVAAALWLAPSAAAALKLTVINESGRPQTRAVVYHEDANGERKNTLGTNANGMVPVGSIVKVVAGDRIRVTRHQQGTGCVPPEGKQGVVYRVPDPVPTQDTITLPDIVDVAAVPAHATAHDKEERLFVGLINRARKQAGLQPVELSTTASMIAFTHRQGCPSAREVLSDLSWPDSSEYLAGGGVVGSLWAPGARRAFDEIKRGNTHLGADRRMIGVVRHGTRWTYRLLRGCDPATYSLCGATGDYGLEPGTGPGGGGNASGPRPSGLRLAQVKQKRKKLRLIYRVKPAASGPAQLSIERPKRKAAKRLLRKRGSRYVLRLRGSRSKWIRVRISRPGSQQFRAAELCHRVKLKRIKGKKAKRWVAAKVRRCR